MTDVPTSFSFPCVATQITEAANEAAESALLQPGSYAAGFDAGFLAGLRLATEMLDVSQ